MSSAPPPAPEEPGTGPLVAWFVLRTLLLAFSIVLLFPNLLAGIADGAWPRMVVRMGAWKWAIWGTIFIALGVTRFMRGPARR